MRRLFGLRRTQLGVAAFLGVVALVASVTAHVRLRTSDGGSALYWSDPSNVPIAIGTTGSDDLDDGSHETAIRSAIEAWNAAGGSSARLVESFDPGTRARRDWESRDVQLVLFDESNTSGFFTGASGTVAVTPVSFRQSGRIVDADVLFNGEDFRFSTSGESGRFDVQDLATHELGHYLGLDHSGVCGATMYPFVDPTIVLHRSLSLDDRGGVRAAYPSTSFGSISGRVVRAGSDARVRGAHVVARSAEGRVMGATLTDDDGLFTVEGLDAGTYTVYAAPLDGPVTEANLGSVDVLDDDFEATTLGTIQVESGSLAVLGMQTVGPDVEASLGRVSDNYPLRAVMGLSRTMVVRGSGLVAGSTLTISDPTIALTNVAWFGSSVSFDITIPPNAAPGHVDLTLDTPSTGSDVLVGAIEITPPDPIVTAVTPGAGTLEGGEAVTIV
ncbi:MAG: matrixin family metalloprotease, partial [Planctomycetota bacterium]